MSHAVTTDDPTIAQVVGLLDRETVDRVGTPAELVARYLEHQHDDDLDDMGSENLAGIISAHVRVAEHRAATTDSVVADTPDPLDEGQLSGSTLLQIVTDDAFCTTIR